MPYQDSNATNINMLVDIARDNPAIVDELDESDAVKVISRVAKCGRTPMSTLIRDLIDTRFQEAVIIAAIGAVVDDPFQLHAAALALDTIEREDGSLIDWRLWEKAIELFNRGDLYAFAAKNKSQILDGKNEYFDCLSTENHFKVEVGRHLEHGDFKRAWDSAAKAFRGRPHTLSSRHHPRRELDSERIQAVEGPEFAELIRTIYNAMAEKGHVPRKVQSEPRERDWDLVWSRKYHKMRSNGVKPQRPAKTQVQRAGAKYARFFVSNEIQPVGVMILHINEFLIRGKEEKRRQKWRKECVERGFNPDDFEN